jgi:SAM-dependent methyltransferase
MPKVPGVESTPVRRRRATLAEGWRGWDQYAEFYDWENARTMGRRDLRFWQGFARQSGGPVLELGCGTGRVTVPLARTGIRLIGVDRSAEMLARARWRLRRISGRATLVRADVTALPFPRASFAGVLAPYGILQSLLSDRALHRALEAVSQVLSPGGRFGLELVPDVPRWQEVTQKVSLIGLAGPNGRPVTLIESVRQDPVKRMTLFEHEFLEGTGATRRSVRFTIAFRTLRVPHMVQRLKRLGFTIEQVAGGYRGEVWSEDADTWLILARKV